MLVSSQSQLSIASAASLPPCIFSCKWDWCRSTFLDNESLVHHVIHEHARRSLPIPRREVMMMRRVEEGSGETEHMLQLVNQMYTYTTDDSSPTSINQGPDLATFDTLSRPPSQFQSQPFLIHHHGPKEPLQPLKVVDDLDLTNAMLLTAPAPLTSPDFALSTPKHFHQLLVHSPSCSPHSQASEDVDDLPLRYPESSNLQATGSSHSQLSQSPKSKTVPKKKSVSRSGTLHIIPVSPSLTSEYNLEDQPKSYHEQERIQFQDMPQDLNESSSETDSTYDHDHSVDPDDSQSFEQDSYPPLQTQAPYQSQDMTQL